MTNLKASVAVLAISGCAAEGVPVNVALDAGSSGREDLAARGVGRGPGVRDDAADDTQIADLGSASVVDARVSDLLAIAICTAMSLAGCDGGSGDLAPDAGLLDTQVSTDVLHSDSKGAVYTGGADAQGFGPAGVTTNLGLNPCTNADLHPECRVAAGLADTNCGWNPTTNTCFPMVTTHINGLCDAVKWCVNASYGPNTVLVWERTAYYSYRSDQGGGHVCRLNTATFVASWSGSGVCEN